MVCPFRVDIKHEYGEVKAGDSSAIMETAQREYFSECMGDECPFYQWPNTCSRVEE